MKKREIIINQFAPKVIPLKWVLKFDPPTIGLVYKQHSKEKKKHLYQIFLNNLIFLTDPQDIVDQLFYEHPDYLNVNVIKHEQVIGLVRKLIDFKNKRLQEMADFMNDYDNQPDIEYEDANSEEEEENMKMRNNNSF